MRTSLFCLFGIQFPGLLSHDSGSSSAPSTCPALQLWGCPEPPSRLSACGHLSPDHLLGFYLAQTLHDTLELINWLDCLSDFFLPLAVVLRFLASVSLTTQDR